MTLKELEAKMQGSNLVHQKAIRLMKDLHTFGKTIEELNAYFFGAPGSVDELRRLEVDIDSIN